MAVKRQPICDEPLPAQRACELEDDHGKPRWLIEDLWVQSGVGLIGGSPKSLKTWVGLELAVSVATGTHCLDRFAVRSPGRALVYLAEDRLCIVRERLETLCDRREVDLDALDVHVITVPSLRLDRTVDVQRLDATLALLQPRLLLLDPFVRLSHADENNAQEVAAILAALREMQRRHDAAIIIVHHTRKNGRASQHGQMLRGSGDFHAWSDSALYLTHDGDALRVTVEHRSAASREPFWIQLTGEPPRLTITTAGRDETKTPPLDQRIVHALKENPVPLRRGQLRTRLAVNNTRLGDVLRELERDGRIRRTSNGWKLSSRS